MLKEERRIRRRNKRMAMLILTPCLVISVLTLIYLTFDFSVPREYNYTLSSSDNYSKESFNTLVSNLEYGELTGIPSVDNSSISLGLKVDITKGVGDFANMAVSTKTYIKSKTNFNGWRISSSTSSDGKASWSPTITAPYLANPYFLNKATTYLPSGVTKLFDRYVLVAVGTYWAEKFGLSDNRGATYRIHLDTGAVYDVIVVDTKGDGTSYYAPNGTTIAHGVKSVNACLTEFYVVNKFKEDRWPVVPKIGNTYGIDYSSSLTIKDDPWKKPSGGLNNDTPDNFNTIIDFKGEVIAVQLIKDARVEELIETAKIQYKEAIKGSTTILKGDK